MKTSQQIQALPKQSQERIELALTSQGMPKNHSDNAIDFVFNEEHGGACPLPMAYREGLVIAKLDGLGIVFTDTTQIIPVRVLIPAGTAAAERALKAYFTVH